jgi:hypothetical protein
MSIAQTALHHQLTRLPTLTDTSVPHFSTTRTSVTSSVVSFRAFAPVNCVDELIDPPPEHRRNAALQSTHRSHVEREVVHVNPTTVGVCKTSITPAPRVPTIAAHSSLTPPKQNRPTPTASTLCTTDAHTHTHTHTHTATHCTGALNRKSLHSRLACSSIAHTISPSQRASSLAAAMSHLLDGTGMTRPQIKTAT